MQLLSESTKSSNPNDKQVKNIVMVAEHIHESRITAFVEELL